MPESIDRLLPRLLARALLYFICSVAFGQQYPFLPVPGSPKNVRTLFQDSRGRLWLGADQLACFDGERVFNLGDYGFPPVASYSITEDTSGAIWIGAETGVYRFLNGRVEEVAKGVAVSVTAATPDIVVAAMGPVGRGIPTSASLVRIQRTGNSWKAETVMSLDAPGPLTLDHAGRLLYAWPDKGWNELRLEDVVRWRSGMRVPVKHNPVPGGAPGAGPIKVLRDRFGCVWIGSDGENIYGCGDNNWRPAPFEGAGVRSDFQETPDGSMLLVGYSILAVGRPGTFRLAKPANGLPPALLAAIQAKDGTLWLGGAQGLYRFASPFRMEYWTPRDGIDNPWCIQRSGANVYAGLNRHVGVLSNDRQHWQNVASFEKIGQVMSLLATSDGSLVAALNPGGAVQLRPDGRIEARTQYPNWWYGLRLAKTPNQEVWLGGISLGRLTRRGTVLKLEDHLLQTQPPGNVLDVQYEEHTRKLWACYNGGLAMRREDGSWREITTKDGLLVDPCWSLAALPNGDVWYGYYNTPAFALIRPIADDRFTVRQFRGGDEVRDPESITFDVDQRGWLWRGGNQGISVATPADAEAGKWLHLDQSDGLSGEGVNSGSYFADSDGSLWFGIDMSIFHYLPPPDLLTPRFVPRVFLSAFSWNGGVPKLAEAVNGLPHGSAVVAHIGSLQFDRRNALRLRYRILPGRSSWRESKNLDLALGKLSSGVHTLQVQARVFTGPWSEIASRSFTVLRPVWLTWPLLLAYTFTSVMLLVGDQLLRRRRQAQERQLLPNLKEWRLGAVLPEHHELAGTLLDSRYKVGELLARGGFASVMAGYDQAEERRCAIKIFRGEVKNKAWIMQREVAALQRIRHPNVVSIYAHGMASSGAPYLVMEFVEGKNLREILEDGPLPLARTGRLARQLAGALDAIHRQGIYHRDVKPENIIVRNEDTPEEELVLIDFSIAVVKDADETLHGLSRAAGTFDYMAPEQAIGYADASSDIFSLAKILIEMLTGQRLSSLLPDASMDLPARIREFLAESPFGLSPVSIDTPLP